MYKYTHTQMYKYTDTNIHKCMNKQTHENDKHKRSATNKRIVPVLGLPRVLAISATWTLTGFAFFNFQKNSQHFHSYLYLCAKNRAFKIITIIIYHHHHHHQTPPRASSSCELLPPLDERRVCGKARRERTLTEFFITEMTMVMMMMVLKKDNW